MLVPVIGLLLKNPCALIVGSIEFVGPCQYRYAAFITDPSSMPETVIVPEPFSRMAPTPADTQSVLNTVLNCTKLDAKPNRDEMKMRTVPRHKFLVRERFRN